ncbi:HNH endonuclease [Lentzea kentuckyensis]|uniref:HNH endonuclease n=1 Tax=Lentzea kentuckyensis TaxID=360086 RepID=UPI00117AA6E5|nr:HNH endonuclease signature motif containing protein [Lentzea kentuckyensis]
MARIRTIKPDFWDDDRIGTLSRDARLLFIATWNVADDEGLLRWTPAYLKAVAFRYDWEITEAAVADMMAELSKAELVCPYAAGRTRERLAWITNFRKHQKINRPQPGRLPAPNLQNADVVAAYLRRDRYECHLCRGPVPQQRIRRADNDACLNVSLDHVLPRAHGGDDYPSNIRVSHLGCNNRRRDSPVVAFRVPDSVRHALGGLAQSAAVECGPSEASPSRPAAPPHNDPNIADVPGTLPERSGNGSGSRSLKKIPPCGNMLASDSLSDSRSDSVAEGNGKGREKETTSSSDTHTADPINAGTIAAAWVDANRANGVNPSRAQVGQVARTAKELLDAGNPPTRVLEAARRAGAKGFTPIDRELTATAARAVVADLRQYDPKTGRGVDLAW